MEIIISKSLINNLINTKLTTWGQNISIGEIKRQIFSLLKYDNILPSDINFQQINWTQTSEQFQGVIINDLNKVIYFAQMLGTNGRAKSRNTYLMQNFFPCYKKTVDLGFDMFVTVNPFDIDHPADDAAFIAHTIKTFRTIGLQIGRKFIDVTNSSFENIDQFLNEKKLLSARNRGNDPIYIVKDDINFNITVYGKLDGANKAQTICSCKLLADLSNASDVYRDYDIYFVNYTEENENMSPSITEFIRNLGIIINFNSTVERNIRQELRPTELAPENWEVILERNQVTFRQNIVRKYLSIPNFPINKCFACDYIVSKNFISSHIYRYADIKKDYLNGDLTIEQAAHLIVSGDNGFLLCPTQDREFEKGYIIFDLETKKFILNPNCTSLTDEEKRIISSKISSSDFSNNDIYTEEFISNVQKHIDRVNSEI